MPAAKDDGSLAASVEGRAVYCIADSRYFAGAAALVNSLRLTGNREEVLVLDCGLTQWQRSRLGQEATVIPADPSMLRARNTFPFLMRAQLPLNQPARAMLLLDCDIIVVRSLEPLWSEAERGRIAAFADALQQRSHPNWRPDLDLPPVRQQPYVNAGCLVLPADTGLELLTRLEQGIPVADTRRSFWTDGRPDDPFFFLDQDIINALLASIIPAEQLAVFPYELAPHPPFPDLNCDSESLRCEYRDGRRPFLLHHVIAKPWLTDLPATPYSELLTRLLLASDLPIRLRRNDLPPQLRTGRRAALARTRIQLRAHARTLGSQIAQRLRTPR